MKALTEYEYGCLRNFMCMRIMCAECLRMNDDIYLCDLFAYNRKIVGDKYHIKDEFFRAFSKDFICRQAEKNPEEWEVVKKFFMGGATLG